MSEKTVRDPVDLAGIDSRQEDIYQVLIHNDDVNTVEHVVHCLMKVFGHNTHLAVKIMLEAHENGQAIAQVEGHVDAKLHRDQLQSYSLVSTIEKV